MRTSGTSAANAVKLFLLSLMQPGQDFFMSVIILRTSGMKNLDCMWLRVWRTSWSCPISECASRTIHLARMVFLIEFPIGVDINTSSKALQATVKEGEEWSRVFEDDLAGEGHGSGEEDLVDSGANLQDLSLDRTELIEHWRSRQISLNRDRTENIKGAASPVGS